MADSEDTGADGKLLTETAQDSAMSVPPDSDGVTQPASGPTKAFGVPATLGTMAGITWRVLVIGVALYVGLIFIGKIAPVAIAIFLGMLLTALALPLANVLDRFMPRVLGVAISLTAIAVVGGYILFRVVESIIAQGPALVAAVNVGINQIHDWLKHGPLGLSIDQLNQFDAKAESLLEGWGQDALGAVASEAGALGTLVTAGAVFFFATFFFMLSGPAVWGWVVGWVPKRARDALDVSGQLAWGTLAGYTRGMVVVAMADALLVFIGLLILQVPLAPALAAVVFMGAFIPVIGAPIATLMAAVVALATKGLTTAVLVIVLTVIVGSFDGDVLQPLVMGKAVSLHPLAIVTIIAAGAIAFGIIGALIAVPIISSIYVVAKFLTNRDPDHPFPPKPPPKPAEVASAAT